MRRGTWVVLVSVAVVGLLASYVAYTQRVVRELRREASRSARTYAQVWRALNDPTADPNSALLDLSSQIVESGVPVILTDDTGTPTFAVNLPFDAAVGDPRVRAYVAELDRMNPPVVEPGIGTVHYGNTKIVSGLRFIPPIQTAIVVILLLAAIYAYRTRDRAEREKVWAGMAREAAHQLGTPLSSLSGWLELLDERGAGDLPSSAVTHMRADLERLERVAHRFERIGRPPKNDAVDVGHLVERVASYFRARVPTLAHSVAITVERSEDDLSSTGDAVLVEWALEAIMKNAVDALAGRGGRVALSAFRTPRGVHVRVADDGPGIPWENRSRIFEAGFSTKEHGWGIGLSLARRIIERSHGGRLMLVPSDRGATFEIILP